MKNYFRNWNLFRIIRLALGIFILVQGIGSEEWLLAALGGFISVMPILNMGCYGGSTCNTSPASTKTDLEETTYKEVK